MTPVGPPPPNPPTGAYVDVLFGPSGAVLTPSASGTLNFWVRRPDATNPDVFAGVPSIIGVFVQTGFAGAYAPVPGPNPYVDIK